MALLLVAAGCSSADRQIERTPFESVLSGESKNTGDYAERVKQANEKFRTGESSWISPENR